MKVKVVKPFFLINPDSHEVTNLNGKIVVVDKQTNNGCYVTTENNKKAFIPNDAFTNIYNEKIKD